MSTTAGISGAGAIGGLAFPACDASDLTVGFIHVGPHDDYGRNQVHAEGAAAVKAVEGITVIEEENVAETQDVLPTMEPMISRDGAGTPLPTSFGYFDPRILTGAPRYWDVRFEHCGEP